MRIKPKLILSPRYTDDGNVIAKCALKEDFEVIRPSSYHIDNSSNQINCCNTVIYAGSLFAEYAAQQLGIKLRAPSYSFLPSLSPELLKRGVSLVPLGDLQEKPNIFKDLFIKPVDEKTFPAKVYSEASDIPGLEYLDTNSLALVSDVVEWSSEIRLFVLDGKPVTGSFYSVSGVPVFTELNAEVWKDVDYLFFNLREQVSREELRATVIDVGYIKDRGLAVIEANPAWASGLYACDPYKAFEVIRESCGCLSSGYYYLSESFQKAMGDVGERFDREIFSAINEMSVGVDSVDKKDNMR